MTKNSESKNIMLIMPDFFQTQSNITKALEKKGYNVFLFSDRPKETRVSKALIRINRKLLFLSTEKYINKILNETKGITFYRVIIINGQSFCKSHLDRLFKETKMNKSVFYMWDSIDRYKYTRKFLKLFDYSITFNILDFENGEFDYFLPLYIPAEYCNIDNNKVLYDLSFIGTARPAKYRHIVEIRKECERNGLAFFEYLYLPWKVMFYFYKLTNINFKNAKITEFKFEKMNLSNIKKIYSETEYILDVGYEYEGGLSLRLFEAIGMNKKIILTNKTIKKYSFFNKSNFFVFDGIINLEDVFFTSTYVDNSLLTNTLTIDKWIIRLIEPKMYSKKSEFIV